MRPCLQPATRHEPLFHISFCIFQLSGGEKEKERDVDPGDSAREGGPESKRKKKKARKSIVVKIALGRAEPFRSMRRIIKAVATAFSDTLENASAASGKRRAAERKRKGKERKDSRERGERFCRPTMFSLAGRSSTTPRTKRKKKEDYPLKGTRMRFSANNKYT